MRTCALAAIWTRAEGRCRGAEAGVTAEGAMQAGGRCRGEGGTALTMPSSFSISRIRSSDSSSGGALASRFLKRASISSAAEGCFAAGAAAALVAAAWPPVLSLAFFRFLSSSIWRAARASSASSLAYASERQKWLTQSGSRGAARRRAEQRASLRQATSESRSRARRAPRGEAAASREEAAGAIGTRSSKRPPRAIRPSDLPKRDLPERSAQTRSARAICPSSPSESSPNEISPRNISPSEISVGAAPLRPS